MVALGLQDTNAVVDLRKKLGETKARQVTPKSMHAQLQQAARVVSKRRNVQAQAD